MVRNFEPGHEQLYSIPLPDLPKEVDFKALETKPDNKKAKVNQLDLDFPPLLSTTMAASNEKGLSTFTHVDAAE